MRDAVSFYPFALANACLPHIKEAVLIEMIAITIKRVIESLSRQILLMDEEGSDCVEELRNARHSLINRILNSTNEEAMEVWREVMTVLEEMFSTKIASMTDIQALPKDVLKRSILYHCGEGDALVVKPVHSLLPDDNSKLLWDVVLEGRRTPKDDFEMNVMNLSQTLLPLGGLCQRVEERASLVLQLYHIDKDASIRLFNHQMDDDDVKHPVSILLGKSCKDVLPSSHPLHIIMKQRQIAELTARGEGGGLSILQDILTLSIKSLGRSHALTRQVVISVAHWHHSHGSPMDAIIFYMDAIKMNDVYGSLTPLDCVDREGGGGRGREGLSKDYSTSALTYLMACCEERREEIEEAQAACQCALLPLLHTTDSKGAKRNDTLLKSLLVMQARLSLLSYCQHYVGRERFCILKSNNNKASEDIFAEDTKFACLLGLPASLPLLTPTATETLSTALHAYQHLLLLLSSKTTTATNAGNVEGVGGMLRKQVIGLRARLSQGSQRILIDSLISSMNARKRNPSKTPNTNKLFPQVQQGNQARNDNNMNEEMTRDWLEWVERRVTNGTSEELTELLMML